MQVPNNIVDKIIPMLLRTVGVSSEDVTECRDELIRCQERDKLQVRTEQSNDISLHEDIFQLAAMFGHWSTVHEPEEVFTGGSGQAMSDIIEWAKEFNNKNKGRVWDGEWYDELEEFFSDKIKSA